MATCVDDERVGGQQCLNFVEEQQTVFATHYDARGRRAEDEASAFDFRGQRGDAGLPRGARGPSKRLARQLGTKPSDRNPRNHQLVGGSPGGRERRWV
jgi:hypothetical protein